MLSQPISAFARNRKPRGADNSPHGCVRILSCARRLAAASDSSALSPLAAHHGPLDQNVRSSRSPAAASNVDRPRAAMRRWSSNAREIARWRPPVRRSPRPSVAVVRTRAASSHRAPEPVRSIACNLLLQAIGAFAVGLIHHENIGDFHQAGLHASARRRPSRERAPPACSRPGARCRFRPAPRRPFRSE